MCIKDKLIMYKKQYNFQLKIIFYRFTVEVADFNFGQTYSDMDYKTFWGRLRDSVMGSLNRLPSTSSESPIWPESSNKYDNMS